MLVIVDNCDKLTFLLHCILQKHNIIYTWKQILLITTVLSLIVWWLIVIIKITFATINSL